MSEKMLTGAAQKYIYSRYFDNDEQDVTFDMADIMREAAIWDQQCVALEAEAGRLRQGISTETERELAALHDAVTDRDTKIIALVAALRDIKEQGEQWLANDHDYSTPYADRPAGDRAANSMLATARAALKNAGDA